MSLKIYVVGVGGVGGYFGGCLANAGLNVTFIARGDNFKVIKENGLNVKSVIGDFCVKPAQVIESVKGVNNPDLILFCVKTYDTEAVACELAPFVKKETAIISFQNGVDNDLKIKEIVKEAEVYPGIAYVISAKTNPGVIEQTGGLRRLVFGDRLNPQNKTLKQIELLMKQAGVDANLSADIAADLWKKFLFICPFAGLTALYGKSIGEILSSPETKRVYEECLTEAITVAQAKGINLPETVFEDVRKTTMNTNPSSKSSLLIDIESGRNTEIETLNGTLVKFANELNISVPINEKIYKEILKK